MQSAWPYQVGQGSSSAGISWLVGWLVRYGSLERAWDGRKRIWGVTASLSSAELFPVQMEGVKLTVNKGLSNRFQVSLSGTLTLQRSQ